MNVSQFQVKGKELTTFIQLLQNWKIYELKFDTFTFLVNMKRLFSQLPVSKRSFMRWNVPILVLFGCDFNSSPKCSLKDDTNDSLDRYEYQL